MIATSALFFESHHFYTLSYSLVIILVFSRLFGMGDLWLDLLGPGSYRSAKNIAEEGVELLGYSLLFYSALGYVIEAQRKQINTTQA